MLIQTIRAQFHQQWRFLPIILSSTSAAKPKIACMASSSCRTFLQVDARRVECSARRQLRYDSREEDEEYGHNMEIAMLESYSESAWLEAFLVKAAVDNEEEVILIFRGFSSCLSSRTASDPTKSVLPARAIIKSIDVIKGPFNPYNIEYIEKGLTLEAFKTRLQPNKFKT